MSDDMFGKTLAFVWFVLVGCFSLILLSSVIALGVVLFYDVILPRIL